MLSVGLAAGLLIGGLVGAAVVGDDADPPASEPTVIAGVIEQVSLPDVTGPAFAVLLHNGGDETVKVSGLRFDNIDSDLEAVEQATLLPGVWRSVRFAAPAGCAYESPRTLGSLRLTVRTPEGQREQEIPLPTGADQSFLEYLAVRCSPQLVPRLQDLVGGVWVLEQAFGDQSAVDILVWRFGRDGSFVADPEGLALLDVEPGEEGRYSLEDGELRIDVDGGYGCEAGDSATWRPSLIDSPFMATDSPKLAVAWLSGSCPDDMKGQIWILRRVLLDAP